MSTQSIQEELRPIVEELKSLAMKENIEVKTAIVDDSILPPHPSNHIGDTTILDITDCAFIIR